MKLPLTTLPLVRVDTWNALQMIHTEYLNDCFALTLAANNIAYCADGKSGVESYGYVWSWDDDNDDVVNAVVSPESQVQPRSFPPFIRDFSSKCHPTLATWQWFFTRNWCGSASSPEHKEDINNLGS